MRVSNVISVLVLLTVPLVKAQDETLGEMVARALQNPADEKVVDHALWGLRDRYDPRAIPAFRDLFAKLTAKTHRQRLAMELMNHGEKDQMYFDELAKYAREAISTTAPLPMELDEQGNAKRGETTAEFRNWCDANMLNLQACLELVFGYPVDVGVLGYVRDRRSIPLLREALSATNYGIVLSAVQGLAWLNDTESIPLIVANLRRFPPRIEQSIAAVMEDFDDPRIGPLLDRFVTNQKWRQEIDENIRARRAQPKQDRI